MLHSLSGHQLHRVEARAQTKPILRLCTINAQPADLLTCWQGLLGAHTGFRNVKQTNDSDVITERIMMRCGPVLSMDHIGVAEIEKIYINVFAVRYDFFERKTRRDTAISQADRTGEPIRPSREGRKSRTPLLLGISEAESCRDRNFCTIVARMWWLINHTKSYLALFPDVHV